jgi:hypothetical protein
LPPTPSLRPVWALHHHLVPPERAVGMLHQEAFQREELIIRHHLKNKKIRHQVSSQSFFFHFLFASPYLANVRFNNAFHAL